MHYYDLAGDWTLTERETGKQYTGHLPGCNYLDLIDCGSIENPFWGTNEKEASKIAEKDFLYSKLFKVDNELLSCAKIMLEISGLDTFATITLNGSQIAKCNNAHREYSFDIKPYLISKENSIEILFESPLPYIRQMKRKIPLFNLSFGEVPAYVRKPQCHFGWDWGPNLPPVGISGKIDIKGENCASLERVQVVQCHSNGKADLQIKTEIERFCTGNLPLELQIVLTAPDGTTQKTTYTTQENHSDCSTTIENPQLWWSNGLGSQPLYNLEVQLLGIAGNEPLDIWQHSIGLRTIQLDTSKDEYGNNFQFIINDVPIFVKGADWIPTDSFVTRTTKEDLEFYIQSAQAANMNMLRVWGGGYYESDLFYELCDRYGILVWQDCGFACNEYPLSNEDYIANVEQEIKDNVRRLCHHTSLALWCGNNEVEAFYLLMKKKAVKTHKQFFFEKLANWIAQDDAATPYWPGSPSSGLPKDKAMLLKKGDNHLWQVWHGMKPIEYFDKLPARFCSEFGLESMPSMYAIRDFTDTKQLSIPDPVMKAHQKSKGGNEKMLFYILSKYRNPASFEDFAYLSQLIQAESVRMATEGWRRKTGQCNGALYWQYNDCWPTASWAGIDYNKQYKALQYKARHFNAMLCVSAKMQKNGAEVYVINDYTTVFDGILRWKLADFSGGIVASSKMSVSIGSTQASSITSLDFADILGNRKQDDLVLVLTLLDKEENVLSTQNNLLMPDKKASLHKPRIQTRLSVSGKTVELTLSTDTYARYVRIEIEGIYAPLSDNFFDIESGQNIIVTFPVKEKQDLERLAQRIQIKTLADVSYKGGPLGDIFRRFFFRLKPINFITWVLYKFV